MFFIRHIQFVFLFRYTIVPDALLGYWQRLHMELRAFSRVQSLVHEKQWKLFITKGWNG